MANCHTIIGAKRFHFRVRDGIGWFTLAMVTKQTGVVARFSLALATVFGVVDAHRWKSVTIFFLFVLCFFVLCFFLFSLAVASDSVFWLSICS